MGLISSALLDTTIPIVSSSVSNDNLGSAIHLDEGNGAWGGHDSRKFQPIAKIASHLLQVLGREQHACRIKHENAGFVFSTHGAGR
jgi:hypothetical protein